MIKWYKLSAICCLLTIVCGCGSRYEVSHVEGRCVTMDSVWDTPPNEEAIALLAPYKTKLDSMMSHVIGVSAQAMDADRPESLLGNLVADVVRQSSASVLGVPADMGLVNIGGIRNSLAKGDITVSDVFEILPFENTLCVLTLKGTLLKHLFENIAARGGEGVSGVQLVISRDGRLLNAKIGGKSIDAERSYTVATIDYLSEGNDGMSALPQAVKHDCPLDLIIRDLFMNHVSSLTKQGKPLNSRLDGRIVVK